MNQCKRCADYYQQYPLINGSHQLGDRVSSSPIRCAFPEGVFYWDNWCCATLGELRTLAGEDYLDHPFPHFFIRDDLRSGSLGLIRIPEWDEEGIQQGYLVMTWYKSRGETGQAWVFWDSDEPEPLTLKTAEWIIDQLGGK